MDLVSVLDIMSASTLQISPPDSTAPELSAERFELDKFLGAWHVVWSTLPLWKDKKDVCITYSAMAEDSTGRPRLDDLVEYRKQSASSDSIPSTVKGIDVLDNSHNGATFNWRGKGWLKIASSHWQFLGYDQESSEPQWAVTFFSKTLFTPAGLDIYMRQPLPEAGNAGKAQLEKIVAAIIASPDKTIAQLAKDGGFVVGLP
ncbi:hypothetical protein NliqN6_0399 [Naganishia liquefaciens]|uniref:Uncharacterized protein n=1 Tax=Naganishia liquefaciens TaxID=104408 RepID=A0A8H3YD67_9TREE|nr:hypothetical protein NliqN6_0399 [Naganishia liquefaciens]